LKSLDFLEDPRVSNNRNEIVEKVNCGKKIPSGGVEKQPGSCAKRQGKKGPKDLEFRRCSWLTKVGAESQNIFSNLVLRLSTMGRVIV
jgi:hypothetical protein